MCLCLMVWWCVGVLLNSLRCVLSQSNGSSFPREYEPAVEALRQKSRGNIGVYFDSNFTG